MQCLFNNTFHLFRWKPSGIIRGKPFDILEGVDLFERNSLFQNIPEKMILLRTA